jgi:hypothetical protein
MIVQRSSTDTLERPDVHNRPETHLGGRWLLIARASWIVLTLFIVILNAVMIPKYNAVLQAPCQPDTLCVGLQLTAYDHHLLHQLGLSLGFVAGYSVALNVIQVVIYCALAALIFWRKSADRMALFCAFMLVLLGGIGLTHILQDTLMLISPAWFVLIGTLDVLGQAGFLIFFLLFPSGRFVPRWTRWVALCAILYWIYTIFSATIFSYSNSWSDVVFFAMLLCIVGVQVYRYRRVSTLRERQQTKWVVYGFCIGSVGFILFIALGNTLLPPVVLHSGVIQILIADTGFAGFLLLIPLFIALAILRSQLYDIDVVINRTLVYGLLTGLLVAIYAGLTISLEGLVGLLTRQTSQPVILVISTLAIAALFQPLRHRLQGIIDRHFYRRKYNASKVLAAFSATLRNEVDLSQLSEQLIAVVQETMQPTHVLLWLRPVEPDKKRD